MAPVGIKYYKCQNQAAGIIIYPQLRSVDNPDGQVVWDGRDVSGYKYMVTISKETLDEGG